MKNLPPPPPPKIVIPANVSNSYVVNVHYARIADFLIPGRPRKSSKQANSNRVHAWHPTCHYAFLKWSRYNEQFRLSMMSHRYLTMFWERSIMNSGCCISTISPCAFCWRHFGLSFLLQVPKSSTSGTYISSKWLVLQVRIIWIMRITMCVICFVYQHIDSCKCINIGIVQLQ